LNDNEELEEEQREVELESFDAMSNKILVGVTTQLPSLEAFAEKITSLHEVKNRIAVVKQFSDIGWIKVNSGPLIKELQIIIDEWINKFTKFIHHNTTQQLSNIQSFIDEVKDGIKEIPKTLNKDRDKKLFTKVITHLQDV